MNKIAPKNFFIFLAILASIDCVAQPVQSRLFDSEEVLSFTLKGNVSEVLNDRKGEPKDHALTLTYLNETDQVISLAVNVKTRGHFRRESNTCDYPPLSIQFSKGGPHKETIFGEQRKLKLVMPCVDDAYVVREYLVYKLYNQISTLSFRARLVKVTLEDDQSKQSATPFYGILLEEEGQMAARVNHISLETKLKPQQIQRDAFLSMSVFQYMIGNTDWSIQFLQNIKLLAKDSISLPIAIPYDFDHAGIVDAPYARPAEELQMRSIQERRYRGYCLPDLSVFGPVLEHYKSAKEDLFRIYNNCSQLEEKHKEKAIRFLDEFYKNINNPKQWQKDFAYPCDKNGTGNVVVKGLKEN